MNFKDKYSKNNENNEGNEYTKKYNISNVIFGEPSIILDSEDVNIMKSMTEQQQETGSVDAATFKSLGPKEYNRIANYGCDSLVDAIKYNNLTASTPMMNECNQELEKFFL